MKRILIILLVLCSLILSACNNNLNIGIIGGSDGPTNIIITDENGDTVKKPIRMIKVDGKLYYDSGKVSDMTPRCGTLDGELKQTSLDYEIPKNDNECNFEGAGGYQNATSITKEVPIDGEWVIFRMFDDLQRNIRVSPGEKFDISVLNYCFYLKGRMPNKEKDNEIIMLTEDVNCVFEDYYKLSSSYYNHDGKDYKFAVKNYQDADDKWGISLSAKDVTNKGLTILFEQFGGSPAGELQTGEWFSLEVAKDNKWKSVPTNPLIDFAWQSIAYGIKKNDITELKVDWKWLYGELPPGYYRIKKEIMDFRTAGDFDKEIYELYFTIE